MSYFHFKNFLKYSLLFFITYNLISVTILFVPIKSLKLKFWNIVPYDYSYIMEFPNNFEKRSLLNEFNRNEINLFLEKNINKNLLNINFWNRKLVVENYDKEIHKKFEESFINLFYLTKNNKDKNLDLKKYFILNYDYFSEKNKQIIIDNY